MGRDYLRAMNGTVVERFFRRDYDEQEDDCKFTRVCPKIPQPGGEHPLPVPPPSCDIQWEAVSAIRRCIMPIPLKSCVGVLYIRWIFDRRTLLGRLPYYL